MQEVTPQPADCRKDSGIQGVVQTQGELNLTASLQDQRDTRTRKEEHVILTRRHTQAHRDTHMHTLLHRKQTASHPPHRAGLVDRSHIHTHTHTHIHTDTHMHTHTHTCTHADTCRHIHTDTHNHRKQTASHPPHRAGLVDRSHIHTHRHMHT